MTRRLVWPLAAAVLGAVLCYPRSAAAQKPATADLGQQGEFSGEHVDTGAAALDTGPEAAETAEGVGARENIKTSTAVFRTSLTRTATARTAASSAPHSGSNQDLDVEGNFDLQEIAGVEIAEFH